MLLGDNYRSLEKFNGKIFLSLTSVDENFTHIIFQQRIIRAVKYFYTIVKESTRCTTKI